MAKHGKKYLAALAKIDEDHWYTPEEAVALVKETHFVKFDSTVEIHMRLGVDPRHADQQVRDVVVLPHGLGNRCGCWSLRKAKVRHWPAKPVQILWQMMTRPSPRSRQAGLNLTSPLRPRIRWVK